MRSRQKREPAGDRSARTRGVWIAACACCLACAVPTAPIDDGLVGSDLAEIVEGRWIDVLRIDGEEVEGARFALAPGRHRLRFKADQDVKEVRPAQEGIRFQAFCIADVTVEPGERVVLSSRVRRKTAEERSAEPEPRYATDLHTDSSIEGRSVPLDGLTCVTRLDCTWIALRRPRPHDCDVGYGRL